MTAVPPAPDTAALREAALAYLARYAATEAAVRRVLHRRIDRWLRACPDPEAAADRAAEARIAVEAEIRRLATAGLLNDAAYAEQRGRTLRQAGVSRRATAAKLAAKGVPPATARDAVPDDPEAELAAALITARKRRIGPFRTRPADPVRELGVLARAGFGHDVARRALDTDPAEAEDRIAALRGIA